MCETVEDNYIPGKRSKDCLYWEVCVPAIFLFQE